MKKPLVLMILDGFGINESDFGNAIHAAKTPNLDKIYARWLGTQIGASGMDVGLPDGQMGNSEVGHTNIGAGRVVYQELTRITKAVKDESIFQNETLLNAMENCRNNNSALHLMGLLSDGGVHSHNTHLYALVKMARRCELTKVYIHCFTDGRDVPPHSGKDYIAQLQQKLEEIGTGKIATIIGRYYAMDRDNRWDRVEKAYNAMVYGEGNKNAVPSAVMEASYTKEITDEFVLPSVCLEDAKIQSNDSIICYNFRPDRAREITRAFVDPEFSGFSTRKDLQVHYVCMTQYDAAMPNVYVAFHPQNLENTFGSCVAQHGMNQLRIAETEKYPHVTFFFNGGRETPYEGEDRALISSPKVATYDLQPEMSAYEVTEELLKRLDTGIYDVVILNYANCDMVGHTGVFEAAVSAVEAVDDCVGKVVDKVLSMKGVVLLTADHGNADQMYEPDGSAFTAHTTNPVPFYVIGLEQGQKLMAPDQGRLADIAPTMMKILGISQPEEMTGSPIIL